jgi:predicted AAA+ superfamily ATPase
MSEKELKTLNLKLTRFKEDFKTYINTGGFPKVINDFFENNSLSEETLNTYTNYLYVDIERFNRSRLILNQLLFKIPGLIPGILFIMKLKELARKIQLRITLPY